MPGKAIDTEVSKQLPDLGGRQWETFEDDNRVTTRSKRWLMAVYPVSALDWAAHFKMARELERGLRG